MLSSLRTVWYRSLRERDVHEMRVDGLQTLCTSNNGCHVCNGDAERTPLGQVNLCGCFGHRIPITRYKTCVLVTSLKLAKDR